MPDDNDINLLDDDNQNDDDNDITLNETEENIMSIVNPEIVGPSASVSGDRIARKYLVTAVGWTEGAGSTETKQIIGARIEDSSIEFNPDIETMTDILGTTYTDVNKTEPEQELELPIIVGSPLSEYLTEAALTNNIEAYNGKFTAYLIAMFMESGTGTYYCIKHANCSLIPTNIGGSSWLVSSATLHLSNDITVGTIAQGTDGKIPANFTFTATP